MENAGVNHLLLKERMTFEEQKNAKALSITVGIHLLLLLVFIFGRYTIPAKAPPPEALGMEVNLGTVENAAGLNQPEIMDDPASPDHTIAVQARSKNDHTIFNDVTTTNRADAPSVATASKNQRRTPENAVTRQNRQTTVKQQPKYLWTGSNGGGGNSAARNAPGDNEGIGEGAGDMGVRGGTTGAKNYRGTPGTGNMSYSLGDRVLVQRPDPDAAYQRGGQVVISIRVNRAGDITSHLVLRFSNPELRNIALAKLKQVKFNEAPKALPEQSGTITFVFGTTTN